MAQLTGIWAAPQAVAISFALVGQLVTVTIAAPCIDACTVPAEDLTLVGGIPAGFRPSASRSGLISGQKQNVAFTNGSFYATPSGFLGFAAPAGWVIDAATQSGVAAQAFSYLL